VQLSDLSADKKAAALKAAAFFVCRYRRPALRSSNFDLTVLAVLIILDPLFSNING